MIFNLRRSTVPKQISREMEIDGQAVRVVLKRNAKARRFILKIGRKNREVILTLPSDGSEIEAMEFAVSQAHWIKSRLEAQPDFVAFVSGANIPLRGELHTIEHMPDQRGTVWTEIACEAESSEGANNAFPTICVAGDERHLARRVRDWLKKQARLDLSESVQIHAQGLGLKPKRVTIRDQTTRWGSCSSSGVLSFSWRLVLAPSFVLDYVAAHEVAHLQEMNHGPHFWKLVEQRLPDYKKAQNWLKQNGTDLHIYGK